MKTAASRRQFIQSIAGAAAASKLMSLMPHAAFAAGEAPKRLLCVFHPMGYLETFFWPKGEATSFQLGESQTALDPYKSKLLYVDGLMRSDRAYWEDARWKIHGKDNEHGSGINGCFTGSWIDDSGYAASASIDQLIASHLFAQQKTPFKTIDLAVAHGGGGHGSAFFAAAGTPVRPMQSRQQAFDTLFANLKISGTPGEDAAFLKDKRQKQRVIDTVRAEFKAVCGRIGNEEKAMCEQHLAGIAQLESRLNNLQPGAACAKPAATASTADQTAQMRGHMDLIKSAFACDLARVATLQFGGADGGIESPGMTGQHDTTHATGDAPTPQVIETHKKWDALWATNMAYLLEQLSSVKEGNGTMLDNTLILVGSDTHTGQSMQKGAHQGYRAPYWMAGGGNFAFRTGRTVKLAYPTSNDFGRFGSQWTYHNALLVSIVRAFGMSTNTVGTWDQGKGPIPGLV